MFKTFDEVIVVRDFFSCGIRFSRGVYTVTGNRETGYEDEHLIRIVRSTHFPSEGGQGYWCAEPALRAAVYSAAEQPTEVASTSTGRAVQTAVPIGGSVSYSEEVLREIPEGLFYEGTDRPSRDVYDRLEAMACSPTRGS